MSSCSLVVDVQRGGPATGLPTKTEQSDLMTCMFPAHGDVRLPIIAVGTVEECFYGAIKAIEWAEKYQGPVILMTEMALAERAQNIPKPDLSKVRQPKREVYTGTNGYLRYAGHELSPMPIPGSPGAYVANGSEHDDMGDTTHLAERHVQMTERRFSKIKLLEEDEYERDQPEHSICTWRHKSLGVGGEIPGPSHSDDRDVPGRTSPEHTQTRSLQGQASQTRGIHRLQRLPPLRRA